MSSDNPLCAIIRCMKVHLQYGTNGVEVDVPGSRISVIEPRFLEGIPDQENAFFEAVRNPIESRPLRETISSGDRVAVVIADATRPLPSDRLLPWLLRELSHVPDRNVVIINGTGSHRANTDDELLAMVGPEVMRRCRIMNHSAHDPSTWEPAGRGLSGRTVYFNREYVQADRRIVLGFIEPHFMAGFSGGYKGVFPAVADIDSIMDYHRASVIGDPRSTWGVLEGNPTQNIVRAQGALLPVDFCINVTLNRRREITGFFCGEVLAAHNRGCACSKASVMVPCNRRHPVVVTTNSGHPLDQNLYQTVKGMSAAAQIVEQDGYILTASRCGDGFPSHGNFRKLMAEHRDPQAVLDTILAPGFSLFDQWEAQLLAMILLKARVGLYSAMDAEEVRRAMLEPVTDITARLSQELSLRGDVPVAVLPEGPMTIPYLVDVPATDS
jgi:lactate racemase